MKRLGVMMGLVAVAAVMVGLNLWTVSAQGQTPRPGTVTPTPRATPTPTAVATPKPVVTPTPPASQPAANAVKVVATQVQETRSKTLVKDEGGMSFGGMEGLRLTLHFTGGQAGEAKRVSDVTVRTATDGSLGNSLIVKESGMAMGEKPGLDTVDEMRKIPGGFRTECDLAPAARNAKSLKRLSGSLTMMIGGQETAVEVKDVNSLIGKAVTDKVLADAKVTVKILDPKASEMGSMSGGPAVHYRVEGNEAALLKVELIDEGGKPVQTMSGSMSMNNGPVTHMLSGTLPAKVGMKLTILSGGQSTIIPIELRDIPLP